VLASEIEALASSVIKPDRPGNSIQVPVDPGPGLVRATQKTGARKKSARPGLIRVTWPNPGETRNIYSNSPVSANLEKQKES
jgi:hypothetical protein